MSRRSTSSAKRDDDAFPIRLKFAVPPEGLGKRLDEVNAWLQSDVRPGGFAVHSARTIGGSAMAIHLLEMEDALALVHRFPDLKLARPRGT